MTCFDHSAAWASSLDEPRISRDIFPLGIPRGAELPLSSGCRTSQRRQLRRRNFDSETIFCLEGLTACYMGKSNLGSYSRSKHRIPISRGASKAYHSKFPYSAAQASVLQHVSSCVSSLGPPPEEMTASGAFAELRGSATNYAGLPGSCCPVSYSPETASCLIVITSLLICMRCGTFVRSISRGTC